VDLRGRKRWEVEEDCVVRSFITCTLHHMLLIDPIEDETGGYAARIVEMRNIYTILVRKSQGKRPFMRPKGR
jgi:hypothetical protein